MELLGIIIVVLIVIGNAAQKDKKKTQKARETAKQLGHGFNVSMEMLESLANQQVAEPAPPAPPADPAPVQTMMREPLVQEPLVREVAQPRVHTHLAADCEEHDASGSLGVSSLEGKDPCHEQQLLPAKTPRPAEEVVAEEMPGLQLDWSGENMVKAFVMQEVLTRPCERRRRA